MISSRAINKEMIQTITVTGLMMAVTIIMVYTPLGTIPLPIVPVTIAFLPTIVTTMLKGFYPGLIVSATAGLSLMIRAFIMPTGILFPFIQNPLVSVLPRMMIPVTVFLVFKSLINTKIPKAATVGIAATVGSITNTVGVLGMMWIIYASRLHATIIENTGFVSIWAFFLSIITTNAIMEIIVNAIIATLVVITMRKARLSKY